MNRWMGAGMAALVTCACGAGALACGDTIVNTTTVYADGGGAGDAGGDVAREVEALDAGDGAVARDAGVDGDAGVACATATTEVVSNVCGPSGPCAGCAGGTASYTCRESDAGGTRPDIDGCEALGTDAGDYVWCCPKLTCVRDAELDTTCEGKAAYLCPVMPGKDYSITPGRSDCSGSATFTNGVSSFWCCDD